ncbi:MAG: TlpA family protein disulfide reductase [Solirubrobacterales bacterium]
MGARRWLYLGAAAAVVALIAFEVATASSGNKAGRPAPALPGKVLQGPKVTLADLRGRPALIDFWASWCESCRHEAPELAQLQRSLGGEATLVGIDYTDREDSARSFIRQYGWHFPVLSDPNGIYGAHYGFGGLPTAIVLDSHGRISTVLRGPQSLSGFRQALREAGAAFGA